MKQIKNRFIPQIKILGLEKSLPRKSHNRRFVHKYLVSDQEQIRLNRQILNSVKGNHYSNN